MPGIKVFHTAGHFHTNHLWASYKMSGRADSPHQEPVKVQPARHFCMNRLWPSYTQPENYIWQPQVIHMKCLAVLFGVKDGVHPISCPSVAARCTETGPFTLPDTWRLTNALGVAVRPAHDAHYVRTRLARDAHYVAIREPNDLSL